MHLIESFHLRPGRMGWHFGDFVVWRPQLCKICRVVRRNIFQRTQQRSHLGSNHAGEAPSRSKHEQKWPSFYALHRHPLTHRGSILLIESPTKTALFSLPTSIDPNTPQVRAKRPPSYFHHTYLISVRDTETSQSFAIVLCRVQNILKRSASCIQDACILAPAPSTPISNKETAPRMPPQLTKKKLTCRQIELNSQLLPLPLPPKARNIANIPPSIEDIFDSPQRQRFVLRPRITRHPWTIDAAAYKSKRRFVLIVWKIHVYL